MSNSAVRAWLPTLDDVDASWLPPAGVTAYATGEVGVTARRAANRALRAHYRLHTTSMTSCPSWLALPPKDVRSLAMTLGVRAWVPVLRRAVERHYVAALVQALGAEGYRRALRRTPLAVTGLDHHHFLKLFDSPDSVDLRDAFGATGVGVLAAHDGVDTRLLGRVRLSFPKRWWQQRARGLRADPDDIDAAVRGATDD